jgi:hypothetical protein
VLKTESNNLEKKDEIIINSEKKENEHTDISKNENQSENASPNCSNRKRKYHEAFPEIINSEDNLGKRLLGDQSNDNEIKIIEINEIKNSEILPQENSKIQAEGEICKYEIYKNNKCFPKINSESILENTEIHQTHFTNLDNISNKDIFVDIKNLISTLCYCHICKDLYKSYHVEFLGEPNFFEDWDKRELIEEVLNKEAGEESPDNQNLISDINNSNIFGMSKIKSLPMEKVR